VFLHSGPLFPFMVLGHTWRLVTGVRIPLCMYNPVDPCSCSHRFPDNNQGSLVVLPFSEFLHPECTSLGLKTSPWHLLSQVLPPEGRDPKLRVASQNLPSVLKILGSLRRVTALCSSLCRLKGTWAIVATTRVDSFGPPSM
jgi:hypothetical protein